MAGFRQIDSNSRLWQSNFIQLGNEVTQNCTSDYQSLKLSILSFWKITDKHMQYMDTYLAETGVRKNE